MKKILLATVLALPSVSFAAQTLVCDSLSVENQYSLKFVENNTVVHVSNTPAEFGVLTCHTSNTSAIKAECYSESLRDAGYRLFIYNSYVPGSYTAELSETTIMGAHVVDAYICTYK